MRLAKTNPVVYVEGIKKKNHMMINKRLINTVKESKRYIGANVMFQAVGLVANIALILTISLAIEKVLIDDSVTRCQVFAAALIVSGSIALKLFCTIFSNKMAYQSSKVVKQRLRQMIFDKLLKIGATYNEKKPTSEIVQITVEGVEQIEIYFGSYLPQFFYAMIAPIILFITLSFINFLTAIILLVCVPLIPLSIMAVQKVAKKLLAKYWGQYTNLGDSFLENLQGLTTLKIYSTDGHKNREMNREAEKFRKITMKVLIMQLNSISIMDLVAYGGAALGIIVGLVQMSNGSVSIFGVLAIILLSADFFLPMRLLGSFFHIAMNGMAASEKIFEFLDIKEKDKSGKKTAQGKSGESSDIRMEAVDFSYDETRKILKGVDMVFPEGSFTGIVGESGAGKSTIGAILSGKRSHYNGTVNIGGVDLGRICEDELMKNVTYISHNSYLFKGTVRENLQMGRPSATEEAMWQVMACMQLDQFFKEQEGLDTRLLEMASNLSGGQKQRLALARALLHDSPIYIFDEATSNIDVESEKLITEEIHRLAKSKTVIMISHRLANVVKADNIYVLRQGAVVQWGSHEELLATGGVYEEIWSMQKKLENYQGKDNEKIQ